MGRKPERGGGYNAPRWFREKMARPPKVSRVDAQDDLDQEPTEERLMDGKNGDDEMRRRVNEALARLDRAGQLRALGVDFSIDGVQRLDISSNLSEVLEMLYHSAGRRSQRDQFGNVSNGGYEPSQGQRIRELEEALTNAKQGIEQLNAFIEKLKASPHAIATVAAITAPGRGVVQIGANSLEVSLPEGTQLGDQVRVLLETNQPDSKLPAPAIFGAVVTVDRILENDVYFNMGERQMSAAMRAGLGEVQAGDRVRLDPSEKVVLQNLGRDRARFSVSSVRPITWDEIGGLEEAKEALREAIEYPIKYADTYAAYGQTPSKGVLLYGPPGCGKTLLARAAANALGSASETGFLYIKGAEVLSKWVGEAEATIRSIFARARDHYRRTGMQAVIFIDEADALLGVRGSGQGGGIMTTTVVPTFLAEMDGLEDSGAFVILSTNRPDSLDPAIVRDERIDRRVRVGRPDRQSVADIFRLAMRGRPCASLEALTEAALEALHSDTHALYELHFEGAAPEYVRLRDMLSGAVITGIVKRATTLAIQRDRGTDRAPAITCSDIHSAVWASLTEMAGAHHNDLLLEKIDQLGRVPNHIRKAKFDAGVQEARFSVPVSYGHPNVQGTDGGPPN